MDEERVINTKAKDGEENWEKSLRPKKLTEYIGQEALRQNLEIMLTAAKQRQETVEHLLFYGPPGLGKTTLAHIIANELGVNLRLTAGPVIEKAGDLAAILTNLQEGDILFIDEIHRLSRTVEEILYPAMEDYVLDLVIGKGPSARTLRIDLAKFTIIGATTKISLLSAPLRDRFGAVHHLDYYTPEELGQIVKRSSGILGVDLDEASMAEVANRSRRTPRVANRLLRRVRDYAQVKHAGKVDVTIASEALNMLGVDELGLDKIDLAILETIIDKFGGGPVGLNTLAAATGEDSETIEDVYEPYLMRLGFLDRSPRGRVATVRAYEHLGKSQAGR
ncbi:Holliday junction branch migration DNA helicase RuvB [Candidatus Falkowbacteria bacterium CG10_big_fil_rev_8_21_14_0_10_37_14]|uniref:Holliday junction branch migration complex subunit RuvB n=1 Tax=Candidatus Falkowbacteria bacterium CG10_big_fil_rev_8_21_14_0_10_37_14 TaxID=1974561 RepID=A0A2M6WTI7_9BACT|nr:Holliday junction branch migration DNA helicase RuvB [Candidatus Falkowbacteria bacterium]PIT96061.1 MAG: Holliday junction branch migration DNA helicase RuvB [Candidatus Falkowbacteria bacterium CG10_big_fil_rev_8_21_14_0_10_37_14]